MLGVVRASQASHVWLAWLACLALLACMARMACTFGSLARTLATLRCVGGEVETNVSFIIHSPFIYLVYLRIKSKECRFLKDAGF